MTTAADDRDDELAFEACLAGRPVPGGAAGLAAFTGSVRESAAQPGRPNAALAELLATGLLADQSSPSARTAPAAGSSSRDRIRRRFAMFFPALLAKFLSAGAVAQAATGAGVVVVAVAGAGTAGVLPGPAQDTFTSLVSDEEVVEAPEDVTVDPADPVDDGEAADPTEVPAVPELDEDAEDVAELSDAEVAAAWAEAADEIVTQADFKEWLAVGKANGWVNGEAVSQAVHARNQAAKAAREAARAAEGEAEEPLAEEPVAEDDPEEAAVIESSDDGDRPDRGSSEDKKEKKKGNGRD